MSPTAVAADNGAQFSVVVSNASGAVTSAVATLTVTATSEGWWNEQWRYRVPIEVNAGASTPRVNKPVNAALSTAQLLGTVGGGAMNDVSLRVIEVSSSRPITVFCSRKPLPATPRRASCPKSRWARWWRRSDTCLGHKLPDQESVWHGKTAATAGAEGDMEFWIPKGANRFHFTGGARFIHGGAMLQEIVVPVITVQAHQGQSRSKKRRPSRSPFMCWAMNHRITTSRHRFELIQMEPVSDRVKPITLKVAIYEGEEPVTSIESVTFDSASGNMDERKKWVYLVLQDRQYDKKTPYRLVLRDAETGIEQQSVPVIIDRAFTDDF